MARLSRSITARGYYHVLNRGNGRSEIFHKPEDYAAFLKVLAEGTERYPVDVLAYCLMPNHWHLVLRPRTSAALGRFMQWVGVTHVRRHHQHYHTSGGGHIYQGRFKSFPVQEDRHLLLVCRYVEANAVRAKLVDRAEDWPWCSLSARAMPDPVVALAQWPVTRPSHWSRLVNEGLNEKALATVQHSTVRGTPFGEAPWVVETATRNGLESTLRPRGRPKKNETIEG